MEYIYFEEDPKFNRASFAITHPGQLFPCQESIDWLDKNALEQLAHGHTIDPKIASAIANQQLMAINKAHPRWQELVDVAPKKKSLKLNLLACGDVGSTILLGLKLLAGDLISDIGIYDIHETNCQRWEFELNQICVTDPLRESPKIQIIDKEKLFDCDVFVFCATAEVPPLEIKEDVRLLQYEKNARIISEYAYQARKTRFKGLFCVVSDPVDLLCQTAFTASNMDTNGNFDGKGLFAEQIEGYGLGVMHARAAYFAIKDERFASYLSEGRAFGPHGNGLIIANSINNYDDDLSQELTELAQNANLKAREADFKPYVAPAISSCVLPLLATLREQWHYSSTFLNGIYLGTLNRRHHCGIELEATALPQILKQRIKTTTEYLSSYNK